MKRDGSCDKIIVPAKGTRNICHRLIEEILFSLFLLSASIPFLKFNINKRITETRTCLKYAWYLWARRGDTWMGTPTRENTDNQINMLLGMQTLLTLKTYVKTLYKVRWVRYNIGDFHRCKHYYWLRMTV